MPAATKHLKRAHAHLGVALSMAGAELTRSWASVVLFYSARDIVHAVLDASPVLPAAFKHPMSHTNQDIKSPGTNVVVKRFHRQIEIAYMDLYATSTAVRYEGQRIDDWPGLVADFNDICRYACSELRDAGRDVPQWLADGVQLP